MLKTASPFFKTTPWVLALLLVLVVGNARTYAVLKPPAYKIVAYLRLWEKWQAEDIDVAKLTHINLAFAGVKDGVIVDSITTDQAKLLKELKRKNRQLKMLISIGGGGGGAASFSDAALTGESRNRFAASVINYLRKYKLNGADIDWEYPVSGSSATDKGRPEDKANFTLLMQTLRNQLDEAGKTDRKQYLLTFAACINLFYLGNIELDKLTPAVDFINLMTYDFYGAWQRSTGFHTNLYSTPEDPISMSADLAVKRYLKAGVPPEKIILGTAFYGYGWTGVTDLNNGRYQPVTGQCQSYRYQYLAENCINRNGFLRFWDDRAKAPYLWNGNTFITYEDEESLDYRAIYIRANRLGGVMIWEYCHDLSGTLLNKIYRELSY
jgi:GH18 family chitinase